MENLNTESIKSIDNPVLSNSMNNVNTVSRESSDNLAFITVESNKNHVTANDEKTGKNLQNQLITFGKKPQDRARILGFTTRWRRQNRFESEYLIII